jgi:transposase-like protein
MSETRKYRKFSAQQKTEIVLASLRGPKSVAELCREHEISDSLLGKWRDQLLAAGAERLHGKTERTEVEELRGQVARLERALGRTTMEVEIAGASCGVGSERARRPIPRTGRPWPPRRGRGPRCGHQPPGHLPAPATPAARAPPPAGRSGPRRPGGRARGWARHRQDADDRRDRFPARLGGRSLASADSGWCASTRCDNRSAVRAVGAGRAPSRSPGPTSSGTWTWPASGSPSTAGRIWTPRSIAVPARSPAGRSTSAAAPPEAIAVIDAAAVERGIAPGRLTLGTDNGSACTSRAFRKRLGELGIIHRRDGYRDPERQAFSKRKLRCIWREEFETLDQARAAIGAYIDRYHRRPHSSLAYQTPSEVAQTWKDHDP